MNELIPWAAFSIIIIVMLALDLGSLTVPANRQDIVYKTSAKRSWTFETGSPARTS
jgi:hypothetical protein